MARANRTVAPGWPHHVYARGNNRRKLVSYPSDYSLLLRCLIAGLKKTHCLLHQLTFMKNHYHTELNPPDEKALSACMHGFHQRYAQIRNPQRAATGKLFEERFHSKVISDDEYLRDLTLYNDANAYRAGLVADPFDHAWSTAPIHGGHPDSSMIPLALWTPSPWYLGLGFTPRERANRYRDLMYDYISRGAFRPDYTPEDEDLSTPYTRRLERPDGSCAREPRVYSSGRWPTPASRSARKGV